MNYYICTCIVVKLCIVEVSLRLRYKKHGKSYIFIRNLVSCFAFAKFKSRVKNKSENVEPDTD